MKPLKECDHIRATITYKSGRTEIVSDQLKRDKVAPKRYLDKIEALRAFPTVVKIKEETF